jgi:two-component system sensor histidine kinase UhpB
MQTAVQPTPVAHRHLGAPAAELELPALVMRRALAVAAVGLVLLLILGIARTRTDTLREMEGSLDLARVGQLLASFKEMPVEDGLHALRNVGGLRHLELVVRDESGSPVLRIGDEESDSWLVRQGGRLASWIGASRQARPVSYAVPLQDGRTWTAVLSASPDSEVLEATTNLLGLFLLALALVAVLLAAMHWVVKRSLWPLQRLIDFIGDVERHDLAAVKALPRMPIRELEAIAHALRHFAEARERSETARRLLARRVLSLQEDERQKLARDLHDEFGQRLTALRVDASWLQRAGGFQDQAQRVVVGMSEQIALIQDDVRRLLARLRPMGVAPAGMDAGAQGMGTLRALLQELVRGWSSTGSGRAPKVDLDFPQDLDDQPIPQDLSLGLYRITQEALTNVVRHAGASSCSIAIAVGTDHVLTWRVRDDGAGIADLDAALRRGTGLAGLKDRVWALGGFFECGSGPKRTGTELRAEFRIDGASA